MHQIGYKFICTRASNRRRFQISVGLTKPAKPAKTGNRQKPVIAKNNCRLYYLRRNRQISKTGADFDGLAKPIRFLNRTGFNRPGLEALICTFCKLIIRILIQFRLPERQEET